MKREEVSHSSCDSGLPLTHLRRADKVMRWDFSSFDRNSNCKSSWDSSLKGIFSVCKGTGLHLWLCSWIYTFCCVQLSNKNQVHQASVNNEKPVTSAFIKKKTVEIYMYVLKIGVYLQSKSYLQHDRMRLWMLWFRRHRALYSTHLEGSVVKCFWQIVINLFSPWKYKKANHWSAKKHNAL